MSNAIDSKVVEMKFDNRDFEANVKNSLSTLDKLKQALNFKGSVKGLNAIDDAALLGFSPGDIFIFTTWRFPC